MRGRAYPVLLYVFHSISYAVLRSVSYTFYVYEIISLFQRRKKPVSRLKYVICHCYNFNMEGGDNLRSIDFNTITDEKVYELFSVDGNESEALNDIYLELFELVGREAMLKIFKHFRGDKMDLPMRLYRPEFIADLAKPVTDRRERAKIARAGGYSARVIEGLLTKRKNDGE